MDNCFAHEHLCVNSAQLLQARLTALAFAAVDLGRRQPHTHCSVTVALAHLQALWTRIPVKGRFDECREPNLGVFAAALVSKTWIFASDP
jgi:hypothetical protein